MATGSKTLTKTFESVRVIPHQYRHHPGTHTYREELRGEMLQRMMSGSRGIFPIITLRSRNTEPVHRVWAVTSQKRCKLNESVMSVQKRENK